VRANESGRQRDDAQGADPEPPPRSIQTRSKGDVMGATAAGKLVPVLEGDPDRRAFIRNGFADASSLLVGHQ